MARVSAVADLSREALGGGLGDDLALLFMRIAADCAVTPSVLFAVVGTSNVSVSVDDAVAKGGSGRGTQCGELHGDGLQGAESDPENQGERESLFLMVERVSVEPTS